MRSVLGWWSRRDAKAPEALPATQPEALPATRPMTASSTRPIGKRRSWEENHTRTITMYRSANDVKNIFVQKLDHIGDFVLAIPSFQLLRDAFPRARITLACGSWMKTFAERSGFFDSIVVIDFFQRLVRNRQAGPTLSEADQQTLEALGPFDIAIDLKVEGESRAVLEFVNAKYKAGYISRSEPLDMQVRLPIPSNNLPWSDVARWDHNRRLLYALASAVVADFDDSSQTGEVIRKIAAASPASERVRMHPAPRIGLAPGAGSLLRKWPVDYFAQLAQRLLTEFRATLVLLGAQTEREDGLEIAAACQASSVENLIEQTTIEETIGIIHELDLFIGCDTGLSHLASASGTPTLCLFSGTGLLGRFGPAGPKTHILIHETECAPCGLQDPQDCRYSFECLRGISVEDALAECRKLLAL